MNDTSRGAGESRLTSSAPAAKPVPPKDGVQSANETTAPQDSQKAAPPVQPSQGHVQGQPAPQAGQQKPQPGKAWTPPGQPAGQPGKAWTPPGQASPTKPPVELRPTAGKARMKRRHWGLALSFILAVLVPFAAITFYMTFIAKDQYSSVAGFTVRQEENGGASELLGGLASLTGGSASSDGDILYEFVLSQTLMQAVDAEVDLQSHYSQAWPGDPVFALWPGASLEDLESYWQRIVRVSYDQGSGLMELRVLAFSPEKAQEIARQIIAESQEMINALNDQAREDAMRYARVDLEEALVRLKTARESMTAFRTRTRIVDPDADLQGRMGVMTNLQQQLAQALIEYDLLLEQAAPNDPRLLQAERKNAAIRDRIADERRNVATANDVDSADGQDYPSLIAEYEALMVDREFAEESYRAALAALDVARAKALRQSRYLATYVQPTRAETSQYPQRLTIIGLAGLFLLLAWGILALVYYSIRDRA